MIWEVGGSFHTTSSAWVTINPSRHCPELHLLCGSALRLWYRCMAEWSLMLLYAFKKMLKQSVAIQLRTPRSERLNYICKERND